MAMANKNTSAEERPTVVSNPTFKFLLWAVLIILIFSMISSGVVALVAGSKLTEAQRIFSEMCSTAFKMTLGALVGLLGGRAAKPDRVDSVPS